MSQLAIKNFDDVTGKHINTSCFFVFAWFSLKLKAFQGHTCRKQTLLPVCEKDMLFFLVVNIKKNV